MMIIHALLVAASLAAPLAETTAPGDRFAIFFNNQAVPGTSKVIHVEADNLEIVQGNLVVLRSASAAVAVFQSYQVQLVVNQSSGGARTFEVIPQMGETIEIRADRMVPQQNSLILFYTGDLIVGMASQNGAQMVIDRGARIGSAERTNRRPNPVRERNRG